MSVVNQYSRAKYSTVRYNIQDLILAVLSSIHNRYNLVKYNAARYNVQDVSIVLADSLSPGDSRTESLNRMFVDSATLSDILTKSITQKVLSDGLKLDDWLYTKKTTPGLRGGSDPWSTT